jgi:hypothetical protein
LDPKPGFLFRICNADPIADLCPLPLLTFHFHVLYWEKDEFISIDFFLCFICRCTERF